MTTLLYAALAYLIGALFFAALGAAILAWNDDDDWRGALTEAAIWPLSAAAILGMLVGYSARRAFGRGRRR